MNPEDERGTYYVPEGETRHLRFVEDWWVDDTGTLIVPVVVQEADSDEPVILKQYYADRLIRDLLLAAPDPDDWVRVTRFEDGGFEIEMNPDAVDSIDEAM